MQDAAALHQIIIVGGGAGGAELAKKLGNSLGKAQRANIMLVDLKLTHLWKPLLHEVAAGTLNTSVEEMEYIEHALLNGYHFRLGRLEGVDCAGRTILVAATLDEKGIEIIPQRRFHFDTLILATGSVSHHFNIPGVVEHCLFLDSLQQANDFQQYLLRKMLKAQTRTAPLREGELHIAIAGAGATGIELAAELMGATRQLVAYGFDQIDVSRDIKITIIEASNKVLPALTEGLSEAALLELQKMNISVMVNERVVEATDKGFKLHSGVFIAAETMVWAAGIKAADFLANIQGLETNHINQLLVKTSLQTTQNENIFAFGDCASCPMDGTEGFVPPRAQAAHQQADLLLKSMKNRLVGKPLPTYKYVDYGSLVNFGNVTAVGRLMGNLLGKWSASLNIEGLLARLFYKSLYQMHRVSLYGYPREILTVLANWLTSRSKKSRLKLH
jgi:NADH dehydrogenase